MISKSLISFYTTLWIRFGETIVPISQIKAVFATRKNLIYDLHLLMKNHCVESIQKGQYFINNPTKWFAATSLFETIVPLRAAEILPDILPNVNNVDTFMLFGSYARGEETPESDIEVFLVVSSDSTKTTLLSHLKKVKEIDPTILSPGEIKVLLEQRDIHNLLLLKTAILEGKVIWGGKELSEIAVAPISKELIRSFLSETLGMEQKYLALLKEGKSDFLSYSGFLRARSLAFVSSMLAGTPKTPSYKELEAFLGLDPRVFNEIKVAYRASKRNEPVEIPMQLDDAKKFVQKLTEKTFEISKEVEKLG